MRNEPIIGPLTSSPVIHRYASNPILTAADLPYPSTLVFNAGVTKYQGKYVIVFRNDYGDYANNHYFDGTNLGLAFSNDGIHWDVQPQPCFALSGGERATGTITRAYDPRLTVIEGRCYMTFAVDTLHGVRGGVAVTEDFEHWEILSISVPENRNMVLFPERIGGKYVRLERPMPVYGRGGRERFDIWLSDSPDLAYWGNSAFILGVEDVPYANLKIGPAAPPVKTAEGWLTTFHAVDLDPARGKNGWEERWQKRYTTGVMLLNLDNPHQIVGIYPFPLMAPEAPYEIGGGFRNGVIFPGGMILEETGEVKFYYGAADTVTCLATADVEELVGLCNGKVG
ncbi:MAG: glycoside hydrolase family 130 protein [Anaerolineae bacterium]|nr:glycoside hydrolase family 130 protein [Anaerolineae bacterium]